MAALVLASCARAPVVDRPQAMRRTSAPVLSDTLPFVPLIESVKLHAKQLETRNDIAQIEFGPYVYSKQEYIDGLRNFVDLYQRSPSTEAFLASVSENFEFYEVYGKEKWGEVFITSYYEPVLAGSKRQTSEFSQPLYSTPTDIVEIDLRAFDPQKFSTFESVLRGRVSDDKSERGHKKIVPYYTREDIDSKKALWGKKLALCWLRPVDAFFLHIQGSGTIEFADHTRITVTYDAQNGHPYEAVGKYITHAIPIEQMSMQKIEAYLSTLDPEQIQSYLNKNPSYVFFKKSERPAVTYFGTSAVARRTIATDAKYFPKGALAYLEYDSPVFINPSDTEPSRTEHVSHFVIDSDKGGAIKGTGRVDLFWGSGPHAKQHAGVLKSTGRLLYLAPKKKS